MVDRLDTRIRSMGEMRETLGLNVLAKIPRLLTSEAPTVREVGLFSQLRARSTFAEAFRSIRTYIGLASRSQKVQVVVVTSPLSSDGKSVVASNLAIILASSGRRVLLIDCNLRDPNLAGIFDLRRDIGMLDLLKDHKPLAEIAQRSSVENLDVVTAGLRATNPSELLTSPALAELMKAARQSYDMTIIDSPTLLSVSDASILGSSADGVLLVVRSLEMDRQDAMRVAELLQALQTRVLGVVVNAEVSRGGTYHLGRTASHATVPVLKAEAEDAGDLVKVESENGRSS